MYFIFFLNLINGNFRFRHVLYTTKKRRGGKKEPKEEMKVPSLAQISSSEGFASEHSPTSIIIRRYFDNSVVKSFLAVSGVCP